MTEIELSGRIYHTGKLDARRQFHVARRLAPVIAAMADAAGSIDDLKSVAASIDLEKIAGAVAALSDADADYIMDNCLSVVTYRDQEAQRDFKIMPRPGVVQFDFVGLPEMLRLAAAVIQENLAGFMPASDQGSSEPALA